MRPRRENVAKVGHYRIFRNERGLLKMQDDRDGASWTAGEEHETLLRALMRTRRQLLLIRKTWAPTAERNALRDALRRAKDEIRRLRGDGRHECPPTHEIQ